MKYFRNIMTIMVAVCCCVSMCACNNGPAYLHPYGDGSAVRPATVSTIKTRVTTAATNNNTQDDFDEPYDGESIDEVPEGYQLCPDCMGIKVFCTYCDGFGKAPESIVDVYDEDSDVYVKKGDPCLHCLEDPGYQYCEYCENRLIVKESISITEGTTTISTTQATQVNE